MKNLAKLILIAGIGLGSLSALNGQEVPKENPVPELKYETDEYKFIPKDSFAVPVRCGILIGVWYDKECKSPEDYQKKYDEYKGILPEDQIFIDINDDGILDMSVKEFSNWCTYTKNKELEKEAEQDLKKNST